MNEIMMPWGKCRGLPLSQVPLGLLIWYLDNCENLDEDLREAMEHQVFLHVRKYRSVDVAIDLHHCRGWQAGYEAGYKSRTTPEKIKDAVHNWFRQMCLLNHPD